jgi:hypothetical protein
MNRINRIRCEHQIFYMREYNCGGFIAAGESLALCSPYAPTNLMQTLMLTNPPLSTFLTDR